LLWGPAQLLAIVIAAVMIVRVWRHAVAPANN